MTLIDLGQPPISDDPKWQERALCAQVGGDYFFPDKGESGLDAKRICQGCEVRAECLDHALTHDEKVGVWGGLSAKERRKLRRPGSMVDRFLQAQDGAQ